MRKILDPEYDFNLTTKTEDHWEWYRMKKIFMQREQDNIAKVQQMLMMGSYNKTDEFFLDCICDNKLLPKKARDIDDEMEKMGGNLEAERLKDRGYHCSKCEKLVKDHDIIYHCESGVVDMTGHRMGYRLCTYCIEYRREREHNKQTKIELSKENIALKEIEEDKIPVCVCGKKMVLIPGYNCYPNESATNCRVEDCFRHVSGRSLIWHCMYDYEQPVHGQEVNTCRRCARTDKFQEWKDTEHSKKAKRFNSNKPKSDALKKKLGIEHIHLNCSSWRCDRELLLLPNDDAGGWRCNVCKNRFDEMTTDYQWCCCNNDYDNICMRCIEKEYGKGRNIQGAESNMTTQIELGKVMSNSYGGTDNPLNKEESYNSDDEVLNNDDEKEMEYVTPGGPDDGNTPQ